MKNTILIGLMAATLGAFSLSPAVQAQDAAPATTCKDGTTTAAVGRGACSGHGGQVKKASTSSASEASTAPNPSGSSTAAATASGNVDQTTCKDGSTSQVSGRGACSGHGGVQKAKKSATAPSPSSSSTQAAPAPAPVPSSTPAPAPATAAAAAPTPAPAAGSAMTAKPAAPAAGSAMTAAKTSTATKSAPTATAGNTDPTGATAKCKDGTYSKSQHHTGSCSHHGGVAEWLTSGN